MGTMAGWTTRKANEATERARRDTAMKIAGAAEECARIREEWEHELSLLQATWEIDPDIGAAEILDRLEDALDRICPSP